MANNRAATASSTISAVSEDWERPLRRMEEWGKAVPVSESAARQLGHRSTKVCNQGLSGIFLQSSVGGCPTFGYVRYSILNVLPSGNADGLAWSDVIDTSIFCWNNLLFAPQNALVHRDALQQRMPVRGVGVREARSTIRPHCALHDFLSGRQFGRFPSS